MPWPISSWAWFLNQAPFSLFKLLPWPISRLGPFITVWGDAFVDFKIRLNSSIEPHSHYSSCWSISKSGPLLPIWVVALAQFQDWAQFLNRFPISLFELLPWPISRAGSIPQSGPPIIEVQMCSNASRFKGQWRTVFQINKWHYEKKTPSKESPCGWRLAIWNLHGWP